MVDHADHSIVTSFKYKRVSLVNPKEENLARGLNTIRRIGKRGNKKGRLIDVERGSFAGMGS